jgi:hypothetical protein
MRLTGFCPYLRRGRGLWTISNGLTVTKQKDGELSDWVTQVFGAENIEQSEHDVGITVEGVWRPGLYYDKDMLQALAETDADLRISEQSLLLLIERLDELLLFVEPTPRSIELCRLQPAVAGDQYAVLAHQHRHGPAELAQRRTHLLELLGPVNAGIAGVSGEPFDRPNFDFSPRPDD